MPERLTGKWEGTGGGRVGGQGGLRWAEVRKTTPLVGDVSEYGGFYGEPRRGGVQTKKRR